MSPAGGSRGGQRRAELLNAMVAVLHDVNVAGGVSRHSYGKVELPVAWAERARLSQVGARAGELLDAVVFVVRNVDLAGDVGGHTEGILELPVAGAERAPLGQVRSFP